MTRSKISTIVTLGAQARIVYRDSEGQVTERSIEVINIYRHPNSGRALVLGFCQRRNQYRTFAMGNILWAAPEDGSKIETFGPRVRVLPYSGPTDSASRLAGWS